MKKSKLYEEPGKTGMLRKFPLGDVGLWVGGILTIGGFIAYFSNSPTLNLAGFFYGIPLLLGGLALKAAELKPVPYAEPPSEEIIALREQQATDIQNQIRKDVTRFRYGQEAHLDSSLKALGLSPTDEERPVLDAIWETATDGVYTLMLEFDSPLIPFETWEKKRDRLEQFFEHKVSVVLSQPEENRVSLALIARPAS